MSAATRDLTCRIVRYAPVARRLLPGVPGVLVPAAVLLTWLLGFVDWGPGGSRALAGICGGSFAATVAVAVGWASDPDRLERWALWAAGSAIAAALPLLIG